MNLKYLNKNINLEYNEKVSSKSSNTPCTHYIIVIVIALVIRLCVSQFGYSGFLKEPMHGDFEAQRHWMEVTIHLTPSEWYVNSTTNNLNYWGLDYPPLTAYHSYLMGQIAHYINPTWVELMKSRSIENAELKLFMRFTVIVSDLIIYFSGVFFFFKDLKTDKKNIMAALMTLMYPGLILIDHGHFQYNSVSLGLCIWAMAFVKQKRVQLAACMFTLSLCFKQMQLYHALPFFGVLFGMCLQPILEGKIRKGIMLFMKIAITTVLTMGVVFVPFLCDFKLFQQVIHRLFPIGRGLFEDKVANIWCSLSVIIKFKELFPVETLFKICLGSTLIACLPSVFHLIKKPTFTTFQYSMVNCSLAFFLFSFQVHEKSILIIALPICTLLVEETFASLWFLMISTLSLFPLLIKDDLTAPYFALQIQYLVMSNIISDKKQRNKYSWTWNLLRLASYGGMLSLSAATLMLPPPARLPDLFSVLISIYCCIHLVGFLAYFYYRQFNPPQQQQQPQQEKKKHQQTIH